MPAPSYRLRTLWIAIGWLLVLAVVYLSLTPAPPTIDVPAGDKIGHALAYGLLMWWFLQLYAAARRPLIAVALIALGVGLEFAQKLTETRSFEYLDMAADAAGVGLGWLLGETALGKTLQTLERYVLR
jgi:VanZ family protein